MADHQEDARPSWQTNARCYRPFRKKRFVKGTNGEEVEVDANEEQMDDVQRARLGAEVSSFYSQLLTTAPSLKPPLKRPRSVGTGRAVQSPSIPKSAAQPPSSTSTTTASSSSAVSPPSNRADSQLILHRDFSTTHFFCATCNDHVPSTTSPSQHRTSTIHLFHTTHKATPTFGIPPNNVGYQMLLHKYDWEQDKGLGTEGQGRLEPIATRLRAPDDRKGVGHEATLARPLRITHTKSRHGTAEDDEEEQERLEAAPLLPNEALALEHNNNKKNKKRKRKEKRQEKRDREDRQRQRDQGVREAVYNEWPVLVAP